jgi:hypothetical protein
MSAGSFGMAVLYRRKEDDSLVILKEINLHELSPSERQVHWGRGTTVYPPLSFC